MSKATSEGSELPDDPRPSHERTPHPLGRKGWENRKGEDLRPPTRHERGISSWWVKEERPLHLEGSWLGSPWWCGGDFQSPYSRGLCPLPVLMEKPPNP